jgi:hypothetical protein
MALVDEGTPLPTSPRSPVTLWSGVAPDHVHRELDELLDRTLPFAEECLERLGSLTPFARTVSSGAATRIVAGFPSGSDDTDSAAMLRLVVDDMRRQRAALRAVALCYEVMLRRGNRDAIRVDLEHASGVAVTVIEPYTRKRFGRGVRYEERRARSMPPRIWI